MKATFILLITFLFAHITAILAAEHIIGPGGFKTIADGLQR